MSSYKDGSSMDSPTGRDGDLEAQLEVAPPSAPLSDTTGVEYTVPTHKKMVALGGYFLLSLGLTIQSKMILGKVCERDGGEQLDGRLLTRLQSSPSPISLQQCTLA